MKSRGLRKQGGAFIAALFVPQAHVPHISTYLIDVSGLWALC